MHQSALASSFTTKYTVSKVIREIISRPNRPWVAGAQPPWLCAPPPPVLVDGGRDPSVGVVSISHLGFPAFICTPIEHLYQSGGGGAQSQGGWAPATQGPIGPANHLPKHLANTYFQNTIYRLQLCVSQL